MLKRGLLGVVLAAAVAGAACDDDSPTAPADPNLAVFTAQLSAANEVGGGTPQSTSQETNARGDVRIEFLLSRDSGNNVTGATVTFIVNFTGFPQGAVWRQAHIHRGASGIAGGVVVDTGLAPANPIELVNGGITGHRFENVSVTNASLVNEILTNPAGFYFNAHSVVNPSGAVRGQLVRIQ